MFETFSPNASQNKLCVSTNFKILGATDQKLRVFEVLRRSLGMAGMCLSQPTRVDHMCKYFGQERTNFLEFRAIGRGQREIAGRQLAATSGRWLVVNERPASNRWLLAFCRPANADC
jgi:hypothetical protein